MTAEAAIAAAQPGPAKSPLCQQLIDLRAEHPMPYAQISAKLGIPAGTIRPTRRRCPDELRRHPGYRSAGQRRRRNRGVTCTCRGVRG